MTLGTHASQLDRWLGAETTESLSRSMAHWYGPPIPVYGVPGRVEVHGGGDFRGRIRSGWHSSVYDHIESAVRRHLRRIRRNLGRAQLGAGFAGMDAVLAAESLGQLREFCFQKVGATGVVGGSNSLWGLGNMPAAGADAAAAPGGEAPTDATTGAHPYANPGGTDTLHFRAGGVSVSVAGQTALVYDRIFQVKKTMASVATEAVSGVPTRYQSTTPGAADSAEGNFLFVEVGVTALAATAHNWTVCTYTDQSGTGGATLPAVTGNSGAIARRLDHPLYYWYCPLAAGDCGIQKLTQMQCSASVATGVINFVIGHPLFWMPAPLAPIMTPRDGLTGPNALARIFDDAAIGILEVNKPATTATTYNLCFRAVYD